MVQKEEKENWVLHSKKVNAQFFTEIDVLLRALDRYFIIENLPFSHESINTKNFLNELITVRDSITRLLGLFDAVLPEDRKNLYWLHKFTESKFLADRRRDTSREELFKQDTLDKGFYLLYDSFVNMKGIISDLIRSGSISYMGFKNLGQLVTKEIRENIYFNPFRKDMNPEFDFIANTEISAIVKSIKDRDFRKEISVVYLFLFRFLRFLSFIDASSEKSIALNTSLIILVLLRSEIKIFRDQVEKAADKVNNKELKVLLHSVAYMFSMETKRVFLQELKEIQRKKVSAHFRGKIENSHGILKNLSEQSVVQISQFFNPDLNGDQIFDSFVTKLEQSLRLREDIYVLHKFIALLEKASENPKKRLQVFTSLKNFMLYFESFTFRLLRYDDYEEFVVFSQNIKSTRNDTVLGKKFHKVLDNSLQFKIFLETSLRHLSNRAELNGKAVDMSRVDALVSQYL
jgi:hypothetical protein